MFQDPPVSPPGHLPFPDLPAPKPPKLRKLRRLPPRLAKDELTDLLKQAEEDAARTPIVEPSFPMVPRQPGTLTLSEQRDLLAVLREVAVRKKESLRLYEPYPEQEAFHSCMTPIRLIRGGNRGGKTLGACIELARAVTRSDPYHKYPDKGRAIVVGKDLLHCSKVIFRKLFKPGAFKIIRDRTTGEWRSYRPDLEPDREEEAEDAPPLIPFRFYGPTCISWENKREEVARSVRFPTTGWEMTFFSGEGLPPQGWDVDIALLDEEIPHPGWIKEIKARIVDRRGRVIWSATPQVGTIDLFDLSERAKDEIGLPEARVAEFFVKLDMNPFVSAQAKEDFKKDYMDDEDEYQVRVEGNFAMSGMKVYPEFAPRGVHRIEAFPIPSTWTRYVAIDPGRQTAAALFVAVPPPHSQIDRPVVYDEIYYKKCNAQLFAAEMKRHVANNHIHGWLIDHHEGAKIETASGRSIEEQYAEQMRAVHLDENGFTGFIWASSDVNAGILAAKSKLHLLEGRPAWLFMTANLRWFNWEIERYINKRITRGGLVVDLTSRTNLHNHLMDCFRYLAMHPLRYFEPPKPKQTVREHWIPRYLREKRKKVMDGAGWGGAVRLG